MAEAVAAPDGAAGDGQSQEVKPIKLGSLKETLRFIFTLDFLYLALIGERCEASLRVVEY